MTQRKKRTTRKGEEATQNKKRKRRKKSHFFLNFFIVIAVLAGMVVFAASDFFAIDKVAVIHNNNYTKDEIVALSKIKTGENIFWFYLHKGDVRKAMEGDSYIDTVSVGIKLPGTVLLDVDERAEIAAVPLDNKYILIDKEGYVLRTTDKEPKLTLLVGLTITGMEEGHTLSVEQKSLFAETLTMLNTMESSDLFFKRIDISDVVIKAYIYDKLICKGTPENILDSMNSGNLQIILFDLYKKEISHGTINVGADKVCSFSPTIE
jgi:cell division protein FtsQ